MDTYQSAKEEVRRAADIVELVGQFVQLKKAGQNYLGLCPFHSEKDPSFTVSPSRQMFHCFGCKKGGDVFTFWMDYHKVAFPEALRDLADRYRVSLPERSLSPLEKEKMALRESLFRINGVAAGYFHGILRKSEKGRPGREYLSKRSIPEEIIEEFQLGYAPEEWDGLGKFLQRKGMDLEKAAQAGLLVARKNGGYYDRFRGRVIFPIFNLREQIVGFGGRVLDDSLPKYLNTPETAIFRKGEFLYGLHASNRDIRQSGRAVVVEGYTDVLALRRHGFREAVATLGTALSREHVRRLKGYADEAVVVFDSDSAGRAAALRSLSFFMNEGLSSRVMVLPEGDDPDSYVSKHGLAPFLGLLDQSIPMFDFFIDSHFSRKGQGPERQVRILKEILPVLAELSSVSQQSLYVRRLSEKLDIAESSLLVELENWRRSPSGAGDGLGERLSATKAKNIDDLHLLNLLVHYPEASERLLALDCRVLLSDPAVIGIYDSMCDCYAAQGRVRPEEVLERIEGDTVRERLREAMLSSPIYPQHMLEQALDEFETKIHRVKISESIRRAKQRGDIETLNELLKKKCKGPG